jgi:hypothetical protein
MSLSLSQKSTCSHLRAVRLQNLIKFKNADISGVVAAQCARHGFYMPQGVVDLMKGEACVFELLFDFDLSADVGSSFANTDYALASALAECSDNRWIMLSYDIWCQFSVNLIKRFRERFPSMLPIISRVRGAIPSAHIRGHLQNCQVLWAFKYIKYSGETYGEMIETSWAEQNQTAGSTKEQNDGHRHDTLDDFFGYWNWTKYHQTSEFHRIDFTSSKSEFFNSCYTYAVVQSRLIPEEGGRGIIPQVVAAPRSRTSWQMGGDGRYTQADRRSVIQPLPTPD